MTKSLPARLKSVLHPFLRSFLFWLLFVALLVGGSFLAMPFFPPAFQRLGYGIVSTMMAFLTVWIFIKFEKQPFGFYGLTWNSRTLLRFCYGLVIGTSIIGVMVFTMSAVSGVPLTRTPDVITFSVVVPFSAIVLLSTMEEIGFRSLSFQWLHKAYGLRAAQVITAFAFAVYHIANGWDPVTSFMGPGVWAFVFGLAAARSNGIAVPNGIHTALNIGQTLVGFKKADWSLWFLDVQHTADPAALERVQKTGMVMHFVVLFGALAVTEYFIRTKSSEVR